MPDDVITAARMGTTSSGTGDLDLIPLAGEQAYSGNNAVTYAIWTPLGAYEEGTASVVGSRLTTRTVTDSSSSGSLISVPVPPTGVTIYLAPEVETASSTGSAPDDAYAPGGDDVAIADGGTGISTAPTGGQLLIGTSAGGYVLAGLTEGPNITITQGDGTITIEADAPSATLANGDYGDITSSADGTVLTIDNAVVTTAKMGGDVTPAGKNLLTAADEAAQLTALGIQSVTLAENEIAIGAAVEGDPGVATTPAEYLVLQKVERSKSWTGTVVAAGEDVTAGDGKAYILVPSGLNGMDVVSVKAKVITAGTTNATTVDLYNVTDAVDILSAAASIASGSTAVASGTVNTSNDSLATDDVLRVDVTTDSDTPAQGLLVTITAQLP